MTTAASPPTSPPAKGADKKTAADTDVAKLSFEQAMAELESVVRGLEEQDEGLDKTIALYERGVLLKRHCEKKLSEAQARIDKIIVKPDGDVATQPLDVRDPDIPF